MRTRGCRTLGFLAVVACLGVWSGLVLAFVPKQDETSLAQREFYRPDLYISSSNVKLGSVEHSLANQGAWQRFFDRYGTDVEVYLDPRSGTPSSIMTHIPMIPGKGIGNALTLEDMATSFAQPVTQIDSAVVGSVVRRFVVDNADVLAVNTAQLGAVRADQVTDQLWQISIPQMVDGIPVRHGRLAATINNGNLILMGTETWGNVTISTKPVVRAQDAQTIGFNHVGGQLPTDTLWSKPELEIVPFAPADLQEGEGFSGPVGQGYGHRLVWTFGFKRQGDEATWQASVDAHTGELIEFKDINHYLTKSVTGGIYPLTNTEICPNNQQCGTMQPGHPMPFANTGFPIPDNFTNSSGLYNYPGGVLTTTLSGKTVRIVDTCGAISESSATGDLDLGGVNGQHDCVSAGASPGDTSASRSAFYEVNKLQEMARGFLPANVWLQGQLLTNVNLNQTCNAFYSPGAGTINFYRSGGGCRNTGEIAAVFDHEWGHALDDNDTAGALSSSSEAYADIVAIYRLQASCVGHGFWWTQNNNCGMTLDGTGFNADEDQNAPLHCDLDCSGVRDADWDKHADHIPDTPANFSCTKCLSGSGPCGRQVHCDAAPARQAAWDLVTRDLRAAPFNMDSQTAFFTGNKVFYQGSGNIGSWQTCTCPATSNGCGATNGYLQWLAADDDNGNLGDGTPHMTAIFAAFDRHAIACAAPAAVNSGCAGGPTTAATLTISPSSNSNILNWTAVPGAVNYYVLRSEGFAGCDFGKAIIATVPGTSYTDNDVANGREYYYNVVAVGSSSACMGPLSACIRATPQPCAGAVSLDRTLYNCNQSIALTLVDSDLIGAGTHVVTLRSTTEVTPENVTLTETPASSGVFTGSFMTSGVAPTNGDGLLSVQNGDTITAKYTDASYCGTPNVDVESSSAVDCQGPVISGVNHQNVTGSSADVLWATDEASNSTVTFDTVTPPVAGTVSKAAFELNHNVKAFPLNPCTQYYYSVSSTDPAGNSSTDTNGGAYYTFTTGVNVQPTYPSTDVPKTINDNSTVESTLLVTDNKPILDLNVTITNITHTYAADLDISLIAPDGTVIDLSSDNGADGDNFINTVFDDEAATSVTAGAAPFTGSFRPEQSLSAVDGDLALGTWRLRIVDDATTDVGSLTGWSLTFTFASQQCGPSMAYVSSTKNDVCNGSGSGGGNGIIDPGETVTLPVTAESNGTSGVTGVSATLTTSTPGVTITDNTATFPDMPAGSSASSNPNHFTFEVDESFSCGSEISFTIHFVANEGLVGHSFFTLPTGSPGIATTDYPSSDVPKPIPDLATATSVVNVADTGFVSDVNVNLSLTHTYDGDLVIRLKSPTNVTRILSNRRGGAGQNFTNTTFDDSAATAIGAGAAPFTGSFRPDETLAAMTGIPANGVWTLEIQDAAGADVGTLLNWTLTLTASAAPLCDICTAALAGEATDLQWTGSGKNELSWTAAPNATGHTLYRGVAADLPYLLDATTDSCERYFGGGTTSGPILTEDPPVGAIYWYLVRGENGMGEGSAGYASPAPPAQVPRSQESYGACP